QIGRDAVGQGRVAALVVEHPVDIGGLEPRVEDRLADRLHGHRARRAARRARVFGLTNADDAVLVAKPAALDDHLSDASCITPRRAGPQPRDGAARTTLYSTAARCYHFAADRVIGLPEAPSHRRATGRTCAPYRSRSDSLFRRACRSVTTSIA